MVNKLVHKILCDMYKNKGYKNENGDTVYKKSYFLMGCSIFLLLIFIPCLFCMSYFVNELMLENNAAENMKIIYYLAGYGIDIVMLLLAVSLIIIYLKCRLITGENKITYCGVFSTKTIDFYALEKITYSNSKNLIFKSDSTKIKFGTYTNGLIEVMKFVEKNIPKYKYEQALVKARKMLKNNRIE